MRILLPLALIILFASCKEKAAYRRVVKVSQIPGVPLKGEADIQDFIQPILTSADDYQGLDLYWDVPYSLIDSELRIKSNTRIIGVNNPHIKLAANVRQPMFINWNASATEQLDENIYIGGLYLDGNGMNNIDSVNGNVTRDDGWIIGIASYGARNVVIENNTFYNINSWGIGLGNTDYFIVRNCEGITPDDTCLIDIIGTNIRKGKKRLSGDLLNVRGGCEYGMWENLSSNSQDDAVAINNIPYKLPGLSYLNSDPVHDIYGRGLTLKNSALGFVVYCCNGSVYNIIAKNITGTVQYRWGALSNNPAAKHVIADHEAKPSRNIWVDSVNVTRAQPHATTFDYAKFGIDKLFTIEGGVEFLKLTNLSPTSKDQYASTITE